MKHVLLFSALTIAILPVTSQLGFIKNSVIATDHVSTVDKQEGISITSQEPGNEKMLAVVFRTQEFCRTELKDFEWDIEFNIVSATVYFSGTNFRNVESGTINSKSLKPLRKLMDRCAPGSIVIFDKVKVVGPDKVIREIPGMSLMLH